MKQCTLCKLTKPYEEFSLRLGQPASRCKPCLSWSQKQYRKRYELGIKVGRTQRNLPKCMDPEYRSLLSDQLKNERYLWILQYLLEHPCVDCGEQDRLVLEFDHVRGIKKDNVCRMAEHNVKLDTIKEEVKKCEVVCSSCHTRRTHKRNNSRRFRLLYDKLR